MNGSAVAEKAEIDAGFRFFRAVTVEAVFLEDGANVALEGRFRRMAESECGENKN